MRITDVFLAFPALLLALALVAVHQPLGGQRGDRDRGDLVALVHAADPRPGLRRSPRPATSASARALGVSGLAHRRCATCCPNSVAPVVVQLSLDFGGVILTAAALSFLGLGAQDPTPEWGLMVSQGQALFATNWWVVTFPGAAILVTALALQPARRRPAHGARPATGEP